MPEANVILCINIWDEWITDNTEYTLYEIWVQGKELKKKMILREAKINES